MGSLDGRLRRLEERAGGGVGEEEEERIRREAMRRATTEDLWTLHAYIERRLEGGGNPTEGEEAAILRYERLREEVRASR